METHLNHALDLAKSRDSRARERFVSAMRAYVLNDMAAELRADYDKGVRDVAEQRGEGIPADGHDVLRAMRERETFKLYSSLRCTAQELVWNSVIDSINAQADAIEQKVGELTATAEAGGSLKLNADLELPRSMTAVDVHLMPGNYDGRNPDAGALPGALYDNGFNVFAFGAMGRELNDIGCSMANFVRLSRPDFAPQRILDLGCTIGHNTLPWKQTFPDAAVVGIDVAAAALRYAHARAEALGVAVAFEQQNAEALDFDDASFDIVFSSMFLHELPSRSIAAVLAEAHRVLRPGGLMLHMELPPNSALEPFDQFYLDWDSYYNNEPFYKNFRDQDYRSLCEQAGFARDAWFEAVMPRYTYVAEEDFRRAIGADASFGEDTGRLSDGIEWYAFGATRA